MKIKTGLWALGIFTIASAVTIACGGSSDGDDDDSTSTAGKGGTSGTAGAGTSGSPSTAGNTSSTSGQSTGGSGTAGSGTAGNSAGGRDNNGGRDNAGGEDNAGGDNGNGIPACPSGVMTGDPCTRVNGGQQANACTANGVACACIQGQGQNAMATYRCFGGGNGGNGAGGNAGAGGNNGGVVTCPAGAMDGDACTGRGACPGQDGCSCRRNGTVSCN